MNPETNLALLCIATAMIGLLLGSTFNGYMLMAVWPISFGPGVITFGTAISVVALFALVAMILSKSFTRLLLVPVFFAGMAPSYCIVISCMAGVIDDHTFRLLTVLSIALAIAVITFLAAQLSKQTSHTDSAPAKKVIPTLGGV